MYGIECTTKEKEGCCQHKRCLYPKICKELPVNHKKQVSLLQSLVRIRGVNKIVVASGIRHDMILKDEKQGKKYLRQVVRHHVSGQLKIAPEHSESNVLEKMGKPGTDTLLDFKKMFNQMTREAHLNQYLTYYMIAAHPGCSESDMNELKRFASQKLNLLPEQIQVFTPTPSTYSTLMYWTEKDPFTGKPCFVEKSENGRNRQKSIITHRKSK